MLESARSSPSMPQFLVWGFAGALLPAGIAAAFTPLILLAPIGAVLILLLCLRCGVNASVSGLAVGAAVIPFVIGYLNRAGPGSVCRTLSGGGQECTEEWSPWPFWAVGAALVVGAVVLYRHLARRPGRVR